MCGIAGILRYDGQPGNPGVIRTMSKAISHRGPDASGFYEQDHISFAHNRLSIIDLSECANQPMHDATGRYHIVFNGEIYNYRELRKKLSGYPFVTTGDTEVILAAYVEWGTDSVKQLAGMFAFAIWDNEKKELVLVRDRMGVKPLYYLEENGQFLFASEIKALLASGHVAHKLNLHAASEFLQYQSVSFPETIVKGIRSVDAGTWMTVNREEKVISRYWHLTEKTNGFNFGDENAVKNNVKNLLMQSVSRRMVSDVPVAAFLSGGIDSSAVVGLMASVSGQPVNTFTVGFNEKEYDESEFALQVAKKFNTRHQQVNLEAANFLDDLVPGLDAMDTPSGDGINTFVVCRAIRNAGIKVALSGVGGDELFAGYPFFRQYLSLMRFRRWWEFSWVFRRIASITLPGNTSKADRIRQMLNTDKPGIGSFYPAFRQIVSRSMMKECTSLPTQVHYPESGSLCANHADIAQLPLLSQVSSAEYRGYTQYTLLKDMDQMSMAHSIELREPFFDHELVSFVLNIPDNQKMPVYPKKLLVEALGDLLPPEIVHRRKQGFVIPWNNWMKKELFSFCEKYLNDIAQRDFINKKPLEHTWKKFLNNDPSVRWMEIWLFVVLEYWLQKNNVE